MLAQSLRQQHTDVACGRNDTAGSCGGGCRPLTLTFLSPRGAATRVVAGSLFVFVHIRARNSGRVHGQGHFSQSVRVTVVKRKSLQIIEVQGRFALQTEAHNDREGPMRCPRCPTYFEIEKKSEPVLLQGSDHVRLPWWWCNLTVGEQTRGTHQGC